MSVAVPDVQGDHTRCEDDCTQSGRASNCFIKNCMRLACWILLGLALWGFQYGCHLPAKEDPALRGDSVLLAVGFGLTWVYFYLIPWYACYGLGMLLTLLGLDRLVRHDTWIVVASVLHCLYCFLLAYALLRGFRRLMGGLGRSGK